MQTETLPAVPSTALFAVAAEWRREAEMHRNSCRLQEQAGRRDKADRHYQRSLDLDACAKRIDDLANAARTDSAAGEVGEAFRVVGDHRIMARPDKWFRGESAKERANAYASVLRDQGYVNVSVVPLLNGPRTDSAAGADGCDLTQEKGD